MMVKNEDTDLRQQTMLISKYMEIKLLNKTRAFNERKQTKIKQAWSDVAKWMTES